MSMIPEPPCICPVWEDDNGNLIFPRVMTCPVHGEPYWRSALPSAPEHRTATGAAPTPEEGSAIRQSEPE